MYISTLQLNSKQSGQNTKSFQNNEYFQPLFCVCWTKACTYIPSSTKDLKDYLGNSHITPILFTLKHTSSEIELEILGIPENKVYGLYFCPVCLLKSAHQVISHAQAELMNMSILSGTYPCKLKHAKVILIYEADDKNRSKQLSPNIVIVCFQPNINFEK